MSTGAFAHFLNKRAWDWHDKFSQDHQHQLRVVSLEPSDPVTGEEMFNSLPGMRELKEMNEDMTERLDKIIALLEILIAQGREDES